MGTVRLQAFMMINLVTHLDQEYRPAGALLQRAGDLRHRLAGEQRAPEQHDQHWPGSRL